MRHTTGSDMEAETEKRSPRLVGEAEPAVATATQPPQAPDGAAEGDASDADSIMSHEETPEGIQVEDFLHQSDDDQELERSARDEL